MSFACCLSMSTVMPTPGVCQKQCCSCGCGGATCVSSILNSIGKWGTTAAGVIAGRPVVTTAGGVSVGASAAQMAAANAAPNMTVIIVVAVVAILVLIFALKR